MFFMFTAPVSFPTSVSPFLKLMSIPFYEYHTIDPLSAEKHVACFQDLAIMNTAALIINVCVL